MDENMDFVRKELQKYFEKISAAGIPGDIRFVQGPEVTGL